MAIVSVDDYVRLKRILFKSLRIKINESSVMFLYSTILTDSQILKKKCRLVGCAQGSNADFALNLKLFWGGSRGDSGGSIESPKLKQQTSKTCKKKKKQ